VPTQLRIGCDDIMGEDYLKTFTVYTGRNLLCTCKIQNICRISIRTSEKDVLLRVENGNNESNNMLLYQSTKEKTIIPNLKEICIANLYALNWEYLFETDHDLLPRTIIDNPTRFLKQCVDTLCIFSYFLGDGKEACYIKVGLCRGSGVINIGVENCPCTYCKYFNPFSFSLPIKGGALPEGSSDLLEGVPAGSSCSEEDSQRYGCLPCVLM
jgi:hypothetical protein